MRIAVLGVGLIGGSIGLAARRRLDAEVVGHDPDPEAQELALELGAIGRGADSIGEAVAGAELVFCAAPVGALPRLVADALAATGGEAAVTDVGSTKGELLAGLADVDARERFIGGHPIAGAETAGVENARDDLFEGARWYLVPTDRSSGVAYDRLQRAVGGIGARPQAIDADSHDRVMATVSHLPHLLANVLVQHAATGLGEDADRLPEIGPSFRDTTRVAGANPAIWADIFRSNREAVAAEAEAIGDRLRDAAALIRDGDHAAVQSWHREALAERRRLHDAGRGGGELRELRLAVENRPGTVAEIALALGRAAVNIEDMTLYPAPDMRSGAISLWVVGADEAQRAAGVVRELGHAATLAEGEE